MGHDTRAAMWALLALSLALMLAASSCRETEQAVENHKAVENLTHVASEARFNKLLADATTPVLVDLYADWCPPCRRLAPVLERLAPRYKGKVAFVKANVDKVPGLARRFGVRAIPTLIFLKGGKELNRIVGAPPEAKLRSALDALGR